LSSLPPTAATTDGLPLFAAAAAVVVPRRSLRSPFGIAAAAGADVSGVAARRLRYSSSVISIAPPGVAAERGEDPAVDGSHREEEGGGVKDDDEDEYHKGGGGNRQGHHRVVVAPSSFDAAGAVANVRVAVVAVGNDDGVHCPPEVRRHRRLVFQYLLIGVYSFR
jgi:hypothetical protein